MDDIHIVLRHIHVCDDTAWVTITEEEATIIHDIYTVIRNVYICIDDLMVAPLLKLACDGEGFVSRSIRNRSAVMSSLLKVLHPRKYQQY